MLALRGTLRVHPREAEPCYLLDFARRVGARDDDRTSPGPATAAHERHYTHGYKRD
jgi:hypothetical protein